MLVHGTSPLIQFGALLGDGLNWNWVGVLKDFYYSYAASCFSQVYLWCCRCQCDCLLCCCLLSGWYLLFVASVVEDSGVLLVLLQLEWQAFTPLSRSVVMRGCFHLQLALFCFQKLSSSHQSIESILLTVSQPPLTWCFLFYMLFTIIVTTKRLD